MIRFALSTIVVAIAIFLIAQPAAAQVHVDFNYCPGHTAYAPAYHPPVHVYHPPVPVYHPRPAYVYRGGYHHYGRHGHCYRAPVVHHHHHGMSPGAEIATGVIQVIDGLIRAHH